MKQADCLLATRDQLWVPHLLSGSPILSIRLKGSACCLKGELMAKSETEGVLGFGRAWQDCITTRTAPQERHLPYMHWDVLPLGEGDKVHIPEHPKLISLKISQHLPVAFLPANQSISLARLQRAPGLLQHVGSIQASSKVLQMPVHLPGLHASCSSLAAWNCSMQACSRFVLTHSAWPRRRGATILSTMPTDDWVLRVLACIWRVQQGIGPWQPPSAACLQDVPCLLAGKACNDKPACVGGAVQRGQAS